MKPRSHGFRRQCLLAAVLASAAPFLWPFAQARAGAKPGTRAWNKSMVPVSPENTVVDVPAVDSPSSDRPGPMVKLNYLQTPWSKVLGDLARASNVELVADRLPEKPFTRWDNKMHEVEEAIRILNRDLERQGLRLLQKENHLVVIEIRDARREYPAYVYTREEMAEKAAAAENAVVHAAAQAPAKGREAQVETIRQKQANAPPQAPRRIAKKNAGPIRQVAAEEFEDEVEARPQPAPEARPAQTTVRMKSRDARSIATIIHKAFKAQAETFEEGPNGLPGFRVRQAAVPGRKAASAVRFSIGIDDEANLLVVEASPQEAKAVLKMIRMFDVPASPDERVKLVPTKKDPGRIASTLQPELNRLAAETRKFQRRARLANQRRTVEPEEENPEMADEAEGTARGGEGGFAVGIGGRTLSLKGEVRIEEIPGIGLVIIGNQDDVATVIAVINEIERLSAATVPQVELLTLRHANSEALASLLSSVYEKVAPPRARVIGQQAAVSPVSIMPIVRPNAILIIAPESDVEAVVKLALELDQPGDPNMDFKVFRLKNAVCAQVVETVDAMYGGGTTTAGGTQQPGGAPPAGQANQPQTGITLAPRVRIISDTRTNSVIVQARPRDMREVALLILELDEKDPETVDEIRLFTLTNSVADDLAATLNLAIQSVLQPARLTGPAGQGQFGQQQQVGAQGQTNPDLREVRSSILEFVDSSGGTERVLRSGILADIRITGDARTNTLVVSAPKQSMELLAGLIELLDQPSSAVAEIKVFVLQQSDATSTVSLLQQLFNVQGGGQRAGQPGQQGQFGQNVQGLLVQGAEDASSTLIPLRFVADARTNSITAIGGAEALGVVEAVLLKLDSSNKKQRENKVYRLKNSPAADVAAAVSQFLQTQQQAGVQIDPALVSPFEQFEREVIVVAEPVSNSLLVSATPRFINDIMVLIETVDRQPQQVLIQALLVEVTLDNTDEWGVELGFQDSILFDRSPVTSFGQIPTVITQPNGNSVTNQTIVSQSSTPGFIFNSTDPLGNNTLPSLNTSRIGTQGLSNFATGRLNSELGYGGLVLSASSENISALLRALAARRRVDVLSRPQILTLDNNLAQIQVGQEVPRVNNFTLNNTTGQATPIIQFRPIGIILRVTPRITPEGMVVMAVAAYKDALSPQVGLPLFTNPNGSVITSPIIDTTNAQTTVSVRSGQTVVLGGMITNSHEVQERKVPILGDIPLLGQAFRYDLKKTRRTELLMFLTPRIVHDEAEAEMFKEIEAQRINFIECEAEAVHGPLYGIPAESDWIGPGGVQKSKDGKAKPPSSGTTIPPGMPMDSYPPTRVVPGRPTPIPPVPDQDEGPALMQDLEGDDQESLVIPTNFTLPAGKSNQATATSKISKQTGKPTSGKKKKKQGS